MGILTNGFYTRGYKSSNQLLNMTGEAFQDTVFNTDTKQRLIYNGTSWVAGNQISLSYLQIEAPLGPSSTPTFTGAVVFPAPISDTSGDFSIIVKGLVTTIDNLNTVGVIQPRYENPNPLFVNQSTTQVIQYSGLSNILYDGVTGTISGVQGKWINRSTTPSAIPPGYDYTPMYGRASYNFVSTVGTIGFWVTTPQVLTYVYSDGNIFDPTYYTAVYGMGIGLISLLETS